jgi:hypothetical protein
MSEPVESDRLAAARSKAAADAKAKAEALAKRKAESAAAAKLLAERKIYAAREANEKAERHARALVVDTDIGWNPDDIVAMWALSMLVLRTRARVLVISSDEMYPQTPRHQLMQRVIAAVAEDVTELGWDRVRPKSILLVLVRVEHVPLRSSTPLSECSGGATFSHQDRSWPPMP